MIFKVGVTGGIGSGKSSVTQLFADLGVPTFSSDHIARELCEPGQQPYQLIVERFGDKIHNAGRTLNRSALGNIVFNDKAQLQHLEQILHPAIFTTMHTRADALKDPYCVLDIPLLVGTAEQKAVHHILVVSCEPQIRKRRVQLRSGWTADKTQSVMDAQLSDVTLLAVADDVIENNSSIADLKPLVEKLHQKYKAIASSRQRE